jgi:hypothetical protein
MVLKLLPKSALMSLYGETVSCGVILNVCLLQNCYSVSVQEIGNSQARKSLNVLTTQATNSVFVCFPSKKRY